MKTNFSFNNLSSTQKAIFLFALVMVLSTDVLFAQSGAAGVNAATTELKKYVPLVTNLIMAIGGIVGIIGGVRIYNKWNSGDQDVNKELMGWGGSCVFLIVAPLVVKGFFGV